MTKRPISQIKEAHITLSKVKTETTPPAGGILMAVYSVGIPYPQPPY